VIEANIKEAVVDGISKREIYHEAKAEDHGISEEKFIIIVEGEQQTSIKYLSLRTKNHQCIVSIFPLMQIILPLQYI
jgi:hypothetical protein